MLLTTPTILRKFILPGMMVANISNCLRRGAVGWQRPWDLTK